MNDLIEKINNLELELDKNSSVKEIKKLNKKIKEDYELMNLMEEYKITQNRDLKEKIINNNLFNEYKKYETEVNFIILEINQRLKKINNKGKCSK